MTPGQQPSSEPDLDLLLLGAVALGALLWAGGAASAWLSGHGLPHGNPFAGLVALAHAGNPSLAWHTPVGPPILYWATTGIAFGIAGLVLWAGWRLWHWDGTTKTKPARRHEPGAGLATKTEVRAAAGRRALVAQSKALRPSLARPRPGDLGYRLGSSHRVECWASVEDSILLLGPPRSGKGMNIVVPTILDAPGAVVTTSTRPDNLAITLAARSNLGPVAVFDPQGLARIPSQPEGLRWSLLRGCKDPQTAMLRAQALVPNTARSGVENGSFWRQQALSATRCLLHAAALGGRPPADLYRWSHGAAGAKEAVSILANHPSATPAWERALDAIISADRRTRDSVWAMVANAFAPLADPSVLAAVSPEPGRELDPNVFLTTRGTLYLLGTATGASATATLVAALIEDVVDSTRRLAARSAGQRLDPPLALVLDEAANYPLPSLLSLMSEGGGSGITTLAALQSLAQARDQWGPDAAGAIWDSAIVKIVLGGSANAHDLVDISRLIGDTETQEWSETRHGGGATRSMSSSSRSRPILEPSEIRRLPIGQGLLLLRAAPPIMMRLRPWTARPDAKELTAARQRWESSAVDRA